MKKYLFIILLFTCTYVSGQGINSLLQTLKSNIHDTTRVKVYLQIAEIYGGDDLNNLQKYSRLGIDLCESKIASKISASEVEIYKYYLASHLNNLGFVNNQNKKPFLALHYFVSAIEIQKGLKKKGDLPSSLINLGYLYEEYGDTKRALQTFSEALETSGKMADYAMVCEATYALGRFYENKLDYKMAISYYKVGLKYAKLTKLNRKIVESYNDLAFAYNQASEIKSSGEFCEKALEYESDTSLKMQIANTLSVYANVLQLNGELEKAHATYKRCQDILKELNDLAGLATALKGEARLYFKHKDYKNALKKANEAFDYAQQSESLPNIRDEAKALCMIYGRMESKDSAQYCQLYSLMNDSLLKMKTIKDSAFAIMRRDYEAYEKNNALKTTDVAKNKSKPTYNLLILSGILIMTIGAFTFWLKMKRK